jgi:uncharacterized protein YdhG (YjbR/CyaY superfamily)
MAKTNFKSIDEYIQTFPGDVQNILKSVRKTIKEVVPNAEEAISYQIPTFKLNGSYLIYFAGWKDHIALYPKPRSNDALTKQLSVYKSGKGSVQFPIDKPMPLALIKKIVRYRVKESFKKKAK